MEVNGRRLCIGCMNILDEKGTCSFCHLKQESYRPAPKCLLPGTVLAERYVLGKVLGEGGTGITYIAWDRVLELAVAVKEYYPRELVSRDVIRGTDQNVYVYAEEGKKDYERGLHKFLSEARYLSQFNQLNGIVPVRDFFYANNTAYIVMEYIKGPSVKSYVKEHGRLKGSRVLELMRPVLTSLARIHKTGMIHRDISPDNLLFSEEGNLVLIDFGAVRARNAEITRSITVMFKRGFSPEEQYRARGKQGAWSDVYALCATMYFMLTGNLPEDAIERVFEDEISSEDLYDIDWSECQKRALIKGLSVRAEERYPNVELLMEDLYGDAGEDWQEQDITAQKEKNGKSIIYKGVRAKVFTGLVFLIAIGVWGLQSFARNQNVDTASTERNEAAGTKAAVTVEPDRTPVPEVHRMPDCTGLDREEAKQTLWRIGILSSTIKWKREYNSSVKKGVIFRQSIKRGTKLKTGKNTKITFVISKGARPKATTVPVVKPTRKPAPSRATVKPKATGGKKSRVQDEMAATID